MRSREKRVEDSELAEERAASRRERLAETRTADVPVHDCDRHAARASKMEGGGQAGRPSSRYDDVERRLYS
jgi:hypothetical protein